MFKHGETTCPGKGDGFWSLNKFKKRWCRLSCGQSTHGKPCALAGACPFIGPHRWVLKQDPVSCKKMSATYITLYRTSTFQTFKVIRNGQPGVLLCACCIYARSCMLGAEGMKLYYSPALRGFGVSGQRCDCSHQLFSLRKLKIGVEMPLQFE